MIHTPIQKLEFPNDRNVRLYCMLCLLGQGSPRVYHK